MAANLRLVANANWLSYDKSECEVTDAAKKLDQLLLMPSGNVSAQAQSRTAYSMLTLVIAAHAAVLGSLLIHAPEDKVQQKTVKPMIVSLVPAPIATEKMVTEPKVVPQTKAEPTKPAVAKQQKSIVKQQEQAQPVTETASQHPVEHNVAEQPVIAEAATATSDHPAPVKAEPTAQVAEAPARAESTAETAIEPPRFGAAYLNNPAPVYPPLARRLGEQGRVLLKVLVSENGLAENVQLDASSGYDKLDRAAIEAVKKWSFIPARRSNQPVSAYVLVPIKFSLGG